MKYYGKNIFSFLFALSCLNFLLWKNKRIIKRQKHENLLIGLLPRTVQSNSTGLIAFVYLLLVLAYGTTITLKL